MTLLPLAASFILIALAELGDKTQLLTLGFASRYPLRTVLWAVSCATALLMALAVIFGGVINHYVPQDMIQLLAGAVFVGFGLWTIFGQEEEEEGSNRKAWRNPFWIVFTAFLLAELGDKTQLAALALSAKYGTPFLVWLGATSGMILINLIAALAGKGLQKLVPEKKIKFWSGALFIVFGVLTLAGLLH
ncbi:MAG: TMEM165/GDT1 family protein [Candidatus Margulisiibacteriota bacterium]